MNSTPAASKAGPPSFQVLSYVSAARLGVCNQLDRKSAASMQRLRARRLRQDIDTVAMMPPIVDAMPLRGVARLRRCLPREIDGLFPALFGSNSKTYTWSAAVLVDELDAGISQGSSDDLRVARRARISGLDVMHC